MEECVFSGDDESQMTSVSYTPRSGEFELNENFIILESDEKSCFRSKCDTYEISASFFCRLLSLVYFFSFLANMNQVHGLFGSGGIYDVYSNTSSFLENLSSKSFYEALTEFPSLFLVVPISDFTLKLVPFVGLLVSFLMFLTGFNCMYSFLSLWVLKLSMVALFKTLPKTMSDLLLLEVGFLAMFVFSPFKFFDRQTNLDVPTLVKWSFRFLTYRVVLLSGVYKVFMLKKVDIRHILMSVPLPTFFNYYLVGLVANVKFFKVFFTGILLFYEVVLSVFLVTPYRSCRLFGGMATLVYSLVYSLLGNFGCFYFLLTLCSLFCLDDQFLQVFAKWKYNPFSKSDQLMRRVSVELIEDVFADDVKQPGDHNEDDVEAGVHPHEEEDENNQLNSVRMVRDGAVASDNDSDNNGFGSVYVNRILSNLNYTRHKDYIREFMNIDSKLSGSLFSDLFKKLLKDALLLFYMVMIVFLTIVLFLFQSYRGMKALLLFLFCILLKSHCEAVKTKLTFLQGQYTLFLLQALLVFEMLKNGPNTWSFLLWVGLIELQLNLSKKIDNRNYLTKMLIQSFLFVHLTLYTTKMFYSSFNEVLLKRPVHLMTMQRLANYYHPQFGTSLNSFYSVNNYKNVYPITSTRFEVVVQGTGESTVTHGTRWHEYFFKRKPSRLSKFPYFVPLYQYTLDEQLVNSFNTNYYLYMFPRIKGPYEDELDDDNVNKEVEKVVKKKFTVTVKNDKNESYTDSKEELLSNDGNPVDVYNKANKAVGAEKDASSGTGNSNNEDESLGRNDGNDNGDYMRAKKSKYNLHKLLNGRKGRMIHYNDLYVFGLIKRLLMGSEYVTDLFSFNPFANNKPKYVRMLLFKYYFNNVPGKRNYGRRHENWYSREFVGELVPPLSYTPTKVMMVDKAKEAKAKEKEGKGRESGKDNDRNRDKMNGENVNGAYTHKEGGDNEANGVEQGGQHLDQTDKPEDQHEVLHVVHTMPAANQKTMSLNMADSLNQKLPTVEGILVPK